MPPRSYYISPREDDYKAFLKAFGADAGTISEADTFFENNNVPYILGLNELSHYLCVETSTLYRILNNVSKNYRQFNIEQNNGKIRTISAPRTYIKSVQWWLLDNILTVQPINDCVHGFVQNRSYISNAQAHLGAKHLLNIDIKDFFPNISITQIKNIFSDIGYSEHAAQILSRFTSLNGRMPQGAPTSPILSNLVFSNADKEISQYSIENGLLYTRYADDLSFSSQEFIPKNILIQLKAILASYGFKLNPTKTKFSGKGDRMEVTGLVINDKVQMPREWRYRAKAIFHQAAIVPEAFQARISEVQGLLNTIKYFEGGESKIVKMGLKAINSIEKTKNL